VSFYFKNLIDMLVELKRQKIIHRDIKLENLHVGDNMNLKLDDFGKSCNY
jgi:serine/threonine protein kinase